MEGEGGGGGGVTIFSGVVGYLVTEMNKGGQHVTRRLCFFEGASKFFIILSAFLCLYLAFRPRKLRKLNASC